MRTYLSFRFTSPSLQRLRPGTIVHSTHSIDVFGIIMLRSIVRWRPPSMRSHVPLAIVVAVVRSSFTSNIFHLSYGWCSILMLTPNCVAVYVSSSVSLYFRFFSRHQNNHFAFDGNATETDNQLSDLTKIHFSLFENQKKTEKKLGWADWQYWKM